MIDINSIINEYDLFGETQNAIKNILSFEEMFSAEDLIEIYNYILTNFDNPKILVEVIKLSDKYKNEVTLKILLDVLLKKDTSEEFVSVKSLCAKAISNYKDTNTVTTLLYCMNNKNEHYRVRLSCADALGKIGDKYAVIPLIDIVNDENEKSVYVRESAVSALGLLGDMRAIEPLVNILETKNGLINKFTFLKERVIEALSKLNPDNNERVFNALKSSLEDDSAQIKINAIEAIMDSEHPKSAEVIKPCLQDKDEEVRKNALIALYNLQGREILDEVISLPSYEQDLKNEAQNLIDEYEENDE